MGVHKACVIITRTWIFVGLKQIIFIFLVSLDDVSHSKSRDIPCAIA